MLDPVIGPEIAIDTPVYAPANSEQWGTVVSHAGGTFLVVWTDYRYKGLTDVYGVRVSSAGTLLDTSGIPIGVAKNGQTEPAVASDGTNWMVAWADARTGNDIYAARVTAAGVVQDPNGIPVALGSTKYHPAIAFDGTNYFITYADVATIRGNFVGTNGTVNGSTVTISSTTYVPEHIQVAYNGTNYLVAYEVWSGASYYRVAARRVNPSGTVLDAGELARVQQQRLLRLQCVRARLGRGQLAFGLGHVLGLDPRSSGCVSPRRAA